MKKLLPHAIPLLTQNRLTELTFFTTNRCNMACKHCFVIDETQYEDGAPLPRGNQQMSQHISHMQTGSPRGRRTFYTKRSRPNRDQRRQMIGRPGSFASRPMGGSEIGSSI